MEEKIFNDFKKECNEELSKLNAYDLDYFLNLLDKYLIKYRESLKLGPSITFGTEIEVSDANIYELKRKIDLNQTFISPWYTVFEPSVFKGCESDSPIMYDMKEYWDDLKKICNILYSISETNEQTSSHIHIGATVLGTNKRAWLNFIKLWATYENIIYRFTNGEYINTRVCATKYASPMKYLFYEVYKKYKFNSKSLYNMLVSLSNERTQAVNFMNVFKLDIDLEKDKNTIEFRTPNGTLDYIIIQNNINLFTKLLIYSKSSDYNDDIIERRKRNEKFKNINYDVYNEIYLSQALEFADLIFDNNLDKINFLKQYLKSFEITNIQNVKCKKFTSR